MFHINLTNEDIQLVHNMVNKLGDFQGPPGLNPPADLAMLGLPNVAGDYHFGQNQKAELLRILNAAFEMLDLDLMVVFNANRQRAEEIQENQEKIGELMHKIDTAQNAGPNNVNMAQGGKRRKTKSRKTRKSKKTRRTKH